MKKEDYLIYIIGFFSGAVVMFILLYHPIQGLTADDMVNP